MLVVGGISSLLGAVVGAITISLFTILLGNSELGIHVFGWGIKAPAGSSLVGVAIVMLMILLLRPSGITGGKELSLLVRLEGGPARKPVVLLRVYEVEPETALAPAPQASPATAP